MRYRTGRNADRFHRCREWRHAGDLIVSGLLLALLGGKPARADIPNPWVRDVVPVFAFPGVEDYPAHVFLLHVRDKGYWGPNVPFEPRTIPISGPAAFRPGFKRTIDSVTLFAMRREDYESLTPAERATVEPEAAYTPLSVCEIEPPQMQTHVAAFTPAPYRYAVSLSIRCGTLRATRLPATLADTVTTWVGNGVVWGVALAGSLVWLGLVVARRWAARGAQRGETISSGT